MSTRSRLEALTAELMEGPKEKEVADVAAATGPGNGSEAHPGESADMETRFPPVVTGTKASRTGPGQMLAFRGQILAAEEEAGRLRERLELYDGALPTRKIDSAKVVPSRWANRHQDAFSTPEFARLKTDIEHASGNVQPILVRSPDPAGNYEIVFGHRRHRACLDLGLPVLAAICTDPISDDELFAAMDRENRERADLSPYEQGAMYRRALEQQLYPSQRRLAEALGISHTWVRKALTVAELPTGVIECFRSPLDIQYRHAADIAAAMEQDQRSVLKRAEKIRGRQLGASAVVSHLTASKSGSELERTAEIQVGGRTVGHWSRNKKGVLTVQLIAEVAGDDRLDKLVGAIVRCLE